MKPSQSLLLAAALVSATGCGQSGAPSSFSSSPATNGFSSLPVGFAYVQSTFGSGSASDTLPWTPDDSGSRFDDHRHGHGGLGQGMMCGGVGGFLGSGLGVGFGHDDGIGGLASACAYDAANGRVECPPEDRDGLSVVRSAAYTDAAGTLQQAFDSGTTNTVNMQVEVSGTRVRRDGDTSVVEHKSDRTVSGLAAGSRQRTVDGTSAGIETTSGSDSTGTFSAVRVIGDTIVGVVVPVDTVGDPTYPTAGTIHRGMEVTVTYQGQKPDPLHP
jgi:hypothetical protein